MKRLILLLLLALSMPCFGATIKFYTDYPNSLPLSSDFLLFQRNNSYVNAAQSQYLPLWFTSPAFTGTPTASGNFVVNGIYYGNGLGLTNVNASGTNASFTYITNNTLYSTNIIVQNITNNTFVTTNVTVEFPGGFTNLNLTPNTVMYADANDAEASIPNAVGVLTNNGVGGIGFSSTLFLTELDVLNFYPTNLFTFITNAQYLMTDGNGKVVNGTGLPATNVLLSAGANITFTTNADGTIVVAGSATNVVNTVTNNTFVNTNIFISTSNAYFNNLYVTNLYGDTNFITNAYFVSGKGNTLVITNNLNLIYLTASKLVSTDGAKNLTNADVSANFTFTGNVLDIAAGASPTLNLVNSTNLTYRYTTNAIPALTLTFGKAYTTNLSADITISAINVQDLAAYETCILTLTNSSGSDFKVTLPNGIRGTPGTGTPPVFYCTNKLSCDVMIAHYGNQRTNAWKIDWAP